MNNIVLKFLKDKGYKNVSTDYYTYIKKWEDWWRNYVDFHTYHDQTGKERKMYRLGMAKRVSEDWSSILYTERDEIKSKANTTEQTNKNNEYLQKQIETLKLYDELPETIEKSAASGTAGAVIRVKHAKVDKNGLLEATKRTKLDIIYLSASQIIPLKVEHGTIVDVAFISDELIGDKKEYYVEIHKLEWDEKLEEYMYKISNTYLDSQGLEIEKKGVVKEYTIPANVPLFSILKPPIANPINSNYNMINGLGFSVYGSAEDQLKACDITFNNFVMDFYLGGKKVFYNKKITNTKTVIEKNADGSTKEIEVEVYPDDVMRQQWTTYGDEQINLKKDPAITEYNPELRVEEDTKGIQFALNMLSFKCGLGTKYYKFDINKGVVTATEYTGDRKDLVDTANKYRKNVNRFICGICKGILLLGRILFKEPVTEDCSVELVDKDGYLVDTETAKQEFRQDIAMGLRQPWEYRVKFLGEDKKTAKAMVADTEITSIDLDDEEDDKSKDIKQKKENDKE